MRHERILVTGATGFIGRPTCAMLRGWGHTLHRVSHTTRHWPGGTWHRLDLLRDDAQMVLQSVRPDAVIHLAWVAPPAAYLTHPDNLRWAEATRRLANQARDLGVQRQIFVGTSLEHAPPDTAYAGAKLALRYALEDDLAGTSWAWARPFQVYGPGEPRGRLITDVARTLCQGQPARCGDGQAIRDFVHVEDVAHTLATLATSDTTGCVDIGTGRACSVADVVGMLARMVGRPDLVQLGALPTRDEPARLVADTRALRALRALPRIPLEVGLREALALHRTRMEHAA